jgi:osmoprotectant transport system permease protein
METIHYILDNWDYLLTLTLQHLWLVALAVGLAILIGVPLGILIVRHKWLATPVLGIATVVLTIPSIALFGLMIPLFSLTRSGHWCPARYHGGVFFTRCCQLCVTPIPRWTACRRACVKPDAVSG